MISDFTPQEINIVIMNRFCLFGVYKNRRENKYKISNIFTSVHLCNIFIFYIEKNIEGFQTNKLPIEDTNKNVAA
jgi:hypothetical protein